LKDEEAIDWRGKFRSFHWTKGPSSRKGYEILLRERGVFGVGERKKEEKECVRKILVLMCGKGGVYEKDVCKK